MQQWIDLAREHWKVYLPNKYNALQTQGPTALNKALYEAAELTAREMDQLEAQGISPAEAWTMVRETYLLLPPEPEVIERLDLED